MKCRNVLFFVVVSMLTTFVVGCGNDAEPAGKADEVTVKNVQSSGCKTEGVTLDKAPAARGEDVALGEGYYECFNKAGGFLFVRHVNGVFTCCSDYIDVDVLVHGNNIKLVEQSTDISCNCVCLFDVSYEIGPLVEGGNYVLNVEHGGRLYSFDFTYPLPDGKKVFNF